MLAFCLFTERHRRAETERERRVNAEGEDAIKEGTESKGQRTTDGDKKKKNVEAAYDVCSAFI